MALTEVEKKNSELNSNFYTINYSDQTDRFIRRILIQKLEDSCQSLHYGIWISIKEEDYKEYFENFEIKYYVFFCKLFSRLNRRLHNRYSCYGKQ